MSEFSEQHVNAVCALHINVQILNILAKLVQSTKNSLLKLNTVLLNISCNKKSFFKLSVTLWVYRNKTQTVALVNLGVMTNFINKTFVETNHLVQTKLANPYQVRNANNTLNKADHITYAIKAYIKIRTYKHI